MKKQTGPLLLLLIALLPAFPRDSSAQERFLKYISRIQIQADASMTVTESITVVCEGERIRRGIYRTFPLDYRDRYGNIVRTRFKMVRATRNGEPEPFHTANESGYIKIYLGEESVYLDPGEYTYEITYKTQRQLGFFDDFDELYWNVTGNEWDFTIESAQAIIELPPGATVLNQAGYTGYSGAKGKNFSMSRDEQGQIIFATTAPLLPGQGLTVAVSWPMGIVQRPTPAEKINHFLWDNLHTFIMIAGLLILTGYYFNTWLRVGKDPEKGVIYPRFSPPDGISPAAARYLLKMGYSDRVFASAIVNLAVKGYLKISETAGKFTLTSTNSKKVKLTENEIVITDKLFRGGEKVELEQKNHAKISRAIAALKKNLKQEFEKKYFLLNSKYLIPGIIISVFTLTGAILCTTDRIPSLFLLVWVTGWSFGTGLLVFAVIGAWKHVLSNTNFKFSRDIFGALFITLFSLPFIAGEIGGLIMLGITFTPVAAISALLIVAVNFLFYHLLKAPTVLGRDVMDQIEGFKMYLEVAEQDRMNIFTPPERTPELFEKYLPYALALDVENEWSEKFADVLGTATQYSPEWYSGSVTRMSSISNFSSQLGGSFSLSISSASRAPGSSSGSSGGGSSGGGSGGGGGGGW